MSKLRIKRAYEAADESDGKRILIDRLWPRGVTKEAAHLELWLKEIAPSPELRKWFNHDVFRWEAFEMKYLKELDQNQESVSLLLNYIQKGTVTLIYSAKDEIHNDAVVLKKYLEKRKNKSNETNRKMV